MINLVEISIKDFKKEIYSEYKKLFPAKERKPYIVLAQAFKKGCTSIIKIEFENKTVGFFILNIVNNYIQIDYFAIFKKYQSQGYGTLALKELQNKYSASNGIFIEIEKLGAGKNETENNLREKRFNFYKQLGFEMLNFDIELFKVIYTPCCFNYQNKEDIDFTIKTLFDFYYLSASKKLIDKHCKPIKNT